MAKSIRPAILLLLLSQLFLATAVLSQIDRASLEGTITDASGAVVSGATVRIVAVDTGLTQERTTNGNGYYRFPGIAKGEYTVSAGAAGFKTKITEEVNVTVGETRTLDIRLEVGQLSDKVEVKVEENPEERSSAESSAVIGELQIENLPMNGRNWASLTRLAPWAQDDGGGDQRTIRFAGRARDDNNFSYDGVDATGIQEQAQKAEVRLQVSPDAIAEYRVSSAMYDAEYGKQAGGQIDVVTKSGTNDLHGSAYGYFRNSAFDARNFTDFNVEGNPYLPPFRMGQYGGTLGGPIKKNKMFYFINYEGLSQFGGYTLVAAVPDPTVQQAALSGPQGANLCPVFQAYPGGSPPCRCCRHTAARLSSSTRIQPSLTTVRILRIVSALGTITLPTRVIPSSTKIPGSLASITTLPRRFCSMRARSATSHTRPPQPEICSIK